MKEETIVEKLKQYEGKSIYLLTLKELVLKGDKLSSIQILLGGKFLTTEAIKTGDKDLLPTITIKEKDIDWKKYDSKPPYDFQKHGIQWLLNTPRGILADSMGLGKSLQTIIAALEGNYKKILVVCPASLKLNWSKEIEVFDPNVVVVKKTWESNKFIVINYDILHKFVEVIKKHKFDLIIADESHFLKSSKSRRSRSFSKIVHKSDVWLLTGTPIANRPIDFYNLLKLCKHELGKRKDDFAKVFCGGVRNEFGFGWMTDGASNLKQLHFKTQNVILRRTKEEVLSLPDKIRTPIFIELENRKGYDRAVDDYFDDKYEESLNENSPNFGLALTESNELVELSVLRQFTAREKITNGVTLELIEDAVEQGNKVVVFTNYIKVIDLLKEKLGDKCLTLDGRVSLEQRQANIDLFQSDQQDKLVMICNYAIAAVGITLTAATIVVANDLPWSPATLIQAEDRCYRIGQKKKVNVLYPIFSGTIEEVQYNMISEKIKNINTAVDGDENIKIFDMIKVLAKKNL